MAQRTATDGGTAFVGPLQVVDSSGNIVGSFEGVAVAEALLTDNSGGTASDTIAAIGAAYDQAEVRNAVASLAAKVNAILAALGMDEIT